MKSAEFINEVNVAEGSMKNIGAGLAMAGAIAAGGAVGNSLLRDKPIPSITATQSTQPAKMVKKQVPAVKQSGWVHRKVVDKFDGSESNEQSLQSTDGNCKLSIFYVNGDAYGIISPSDKIDYSFHMNGPSPRLKINGKVSDTGKFDYNNATRNYISVGWLAADEILKTKQPIQVEVWTKDKGQVIYTFNP
jgi:hypothetical protein